jgi:hypothetical protein
MYYPKGIQKVAYVWWSYVCLLVRFAECMSGGPLTYVRTTDSSVRPPDLAYVRLLRIKVCLLFSKGSKCVLANTKDLRPCLSSSIKGSC